MMRKYSFKQLVATALVLGVLVTSIFPSSAYAEEVGEQITETSETVYGDLSEYAPQIEQYIKEAIEAQGGDISDETLYEEVKADIIAKIESGEISLDKAEEETEETDAESEDGKKESETEESQGETSDINEDVAEEAEEQPEDAVEAPSKVLLLIADTVPHDTFGAVAVEQLSGMVRLTYESEDLSQKALEQFTTAGLTVEYDTPVEMIDDTATVVSEVETEEVAVEQIDTVEELLTEEVSVESKQVRHIKVAIIDTGCDLNAINGRVAEGTDMTITDANGHGTLMAEIVASQTTENVKILPMKAFDDDGTSTVGRVYQAINDAINLNVDVINLSMDGAGTSPMLTKAIDYATSQGITVVVSAGNDASDVAGFMPGNIENAITVSATDKSEVFATYSNFGEKIDYSALGEIIKDQGTEDTSDDLYYEGTSIASAFVSGYAACVLDNNHNADVVATFDKYAKDLGEMGRDAYYGKGFLSIENIAFDVDKSGDAKEDITNSDKEEDKQENNKTEEEDAKQVLRTNYSCNGTSCTHNQSTVDESKMVYDSCHSDGYFPAAVQNDTTYSYTKAQLRQNGWNRYIVCDSQYSVETLANNSYNKKVKKSEASASSLKKILASNESAIIYLGCDVEITDTMIVNGNKILNGNGHTIRMNIADNVFVWGKDGNLSYPPSAIKVRSTYFRLINTRLMGEADEYSNGYAKAFTGVDVQTGTAEFINCAMAHHGNAVTSNAGTVVRAYGGKYYHNKANGFSTAGRCELYGVACYNNVQKNENTLGGGGYSGDYPDLSYPGDHQNAGVSAHSTLITNSWSGYGQYRNCEFLRNGKHGIYIAKDVPSGCTISIQNTLADSNGTEDVNGSGITFGSRSDAVYIPCTISGVTSQKNANCGIIYQYKNNSGGLTVQNAACYYNKVGLRVKGLYASTVGGDFSANTSHGLNCADNGTLTINGSVAHSNGAHGILHESGTLTISNAYAGSYHNGYGWVDAGNTYSGVCVKSGTAYIDGGTYLYNKTGLECQGGTMNVRSSGTIDVSSNDGNGILAKTGGNVIVDANAALYVYSNKKNGICVEKDSSATVSSGRIYSNTNSGVYNAGKFNLNYAWVGTYYDGANWVNVGNGESGLYCNGGMMDIVDGVIFYNKNGISCSGGAVNISGGSLGNNQYGIYNNSGATTTLSGGDVYNNTTYGVYNAGTFTMSGGKVRDNANVDGILNETSGKTTISGGTLSGNKTGILNWGNANITKATIQSNENGITNEKSGKTTINGTNKTDIQIKSNTYGVYNTANSNGVDINRATITGNTTADLGQSGETFKMNGANTNTNVIELGVKDGVPEVVTIDGALTEKKTVIIKADPDTMTKADIDKNMSVGRPMFKCINMTKAQKQAMIDPENGKLKLQSGQQTLMGNGTKRDAIMRPCKGTNSNDSNRKSEDYIVLSTKYAGIYKVKESLEGVDFKIPDSAVIFWNEKNDIKMPELWATIGGVLKKFDIIGWLKDGLGNPVSVGSIMSFLFGESNRDHEIVAQMGVVNLCVNGNGQSEGENYVIEEFNCVTDTLPQNTFKKEFLDDYYYIELGEQKRHETKYSYQGWSLSDESTYLSEGVMQPQGKLDYADVLTYMDEHKDSITYGDNGLPNIPLYAVWDKYPELQAKDVGIVTGWVDESSGFAKTDAELQEIIFEKVLGTDDEDGTLTNGVEEKGVICTDFDKEEIRQFKPELVINAVTVNIPEPQPSPIGLPMVWEM